MILKTVPETSLDSLPSIR